ncbi:MAG: hypothetical protein AB7F32_03145 [Victivallaceae bacterium]
MNWHKVLLGGLAAAVLAGGTPVFAAGEKDPKAEIIKQLFELGEGCKAVVDPATGELKAVYIVGSAPISRSLSAPEALRKARRDALLEVRKSFSDYLGSSVGASFDAKTREAKLVEGVASGQAAGTSTEKIARLSENQELFNTITESIQGGLEKEGERREEGGLIAVYSWEPAKCAALRKAVGAPAAPVAAASALPAAGEAPKEESSKAPAPPAVSPAAVVPAVPNAAVSDKTVIAPNLSGTP